MLWFASSNLALEHVVALGEVVGRHVLSILTTFWALARLVGRVEVLLLADLAHVHLVLLAQAEVLRPVARLALVVFGPGSLGQDA